MENANIYYSIGMNFYFHEPDERTYLVYRTGEEIARFDDLDDAKDFIDEWKEIDKYNESLLK